MTPPTSGSNTGGRGRRARGVGAAEVRRHNLWLVLRRLHLGGPARRSDLTALTGLNRSTVADLIGELVQLGLAVEGPSVSASGPGRPSPLVRPRPEGATAIAVEITVDSVAVAAIGIGGHIFTRTRVGGTGNHPSPADTVSLIDEMVAPILDALPADRALVGVGVAVAGVTRREDGFVHLAPNLGWRDVALGDLIAAELGVDMPVLVANDADMGVLAEHLRGTAIGVDDVIYIGGEVGIGMGVIVGGRPLIGSAGYAGESGHMIVNPAGEACRCGSIGCWETEAGERALMQRIGGSPRTGLATVEATAARAEAGDPAVIAAMEETGRWLGIGIANLINIFNPEVVVLGGLYHRFFPYLEPTMTSTVHARALGPAAHRVRIVETALGDDAQLVGAAELVLSTLITDPTAIIAAEAPVPAPGQPKAR
jgi:predicted NBD/HSP70 family sugar kinase